MTDFMDSKGCDDIFDGTLAEWGTALQSMLTGKATPEEAMARANAALAAGLTLTKRHIEMAQRAFSDAQQDSMENAPFASVGGLDKRNDMTAPSYIPEADRAAYLEGYRAAALKMYGADWATCSFSWSPAITIPATTEEPQT